MPFHAKNTQLHSQPMRNLTDDSLSIDPWNVTCDSVTHNTGNSPPITKDERMKE
ncbi:hypothetical protein M422DRAFT_31649 [Sphaerobolus stellatus SS14]|uniref:Uncharacterized protein n=1 Tax=Sphaerobolus stellatus (strain SS14) TaxID=990650 RepID=A0A0C9VJ64_SPHS4|nr:hypothetical protein M422DRAFT_31649 [Sphaerobolus stellatus SS14]